MTEAVLRVWREGALQWWAEYWRPRTVKDPPEGWDWGDRPPKIPGMTREAVALALTRRGAKKKAWRMAEVGGEPKPDLRVVSWKVER